jgi:hypothetical protein
MNRSGDARRPFASFLRRYTKTWVHALATAGLTAFGMLTFLHWGFAVVAIGVYLSAPVVLYVTDAGVIPSDGDEESRTETTSDDRTDSRSAGPDDERQRTSETGVTETGTATGTRTPDSAASNHGDDETSDRASEGDTVDSAEEGDTPDSAEEGDTPDSADEGDTPDSADERDSVEPADERDSVEPADEWTAADAPTDADLADAAVVPGGAYAVGAGGVVLGTADASAGESSDGPSSGANWRVVLEDGPSADANDLAGVAATADGEAVWVVGDGGALGRLEAATDRHVDHSSSLDATDSWTDVAVIGPSGEETLLLVNGSGEVRRGRYRDGELAWSSPTKPGSGSSFAAAAAGASGSYLCDTNDGVFEGDGEEFRCVGVDGADGTLEDVAATAPGDCGVVDDAGTYHRYDGTNWTPVSLASDPLRGLAASSAADRRVAVGDEGRLFERSRESGGWERRDVPATVSLRGVALDDGDGDRSDPDDGASTPPPPRRGVAVGEDGTLLERGL